MTEFDVTKEEILAIESRMVGVQKICRGIHCTAAISNGVDLESISEGLHDIADGIELFFMPQLEGQLKVMQSRQHDLARHRDLGREYAMRELVQATEQVHMMEEQVRQMQQAAASMPEGVREMVGFMVSLFDHFLAQAKERQRMAQEHVEHPMEEESEAGVSVGQIDEPEMDPEPRPYPDGASEYQAEREDQEG